MARPTRLTRRSFLGCSAGLGVALPAFVTASLPATEVMNTAPTPLPPLPLLPSISRDPAVDSLGVHVIGPELDTPFGIFIRQLSDDVFRRLIAEFPSVRVINGRRVGHTEDVVEHGRVASYCLTEQWNTGTEIGGEFLNGRHLVNFDLERFRHRTSHWERGLVLCMGGLIPTREAFAPAAVVGLPELPLGLAWAAHYLDERTGAAMRVVSDYEVQWDHAVVRYDVLVGERP